jgi:hypothetical protein
MPACVPEGFTAPQALQDLERLVDQLGARPGICRLPDIPECAIVERAQADRKD